MELDRMTALQRLLAKGEKQGPCFLCGPRHLARHRLWDNIDEDLRRGHGAKCIAYEYAVTVEEVRDVREAYAEARRKKKALPGRAREGR